MDLRVVRYEVERGVGLVTLDRPDRMNAWTIRMEREYAWVLHRAERDPAVRVVVITGAGRGFCVGADFKALDVMSDTGTYDVAGERPADEEVVAGEHAPTLGDAPHQAGDRGGERSRRGRGLRPALLRRHPLRRQRGQAHHLVRPSRSARRARGVVAVEPPGRARTRRRPALLESGDPRRGGGGPGPRQSRRCRPRSCCRSRWTTRARWRRRSHRRRSA